LKEKYHFNVEDSKRMADFLLPLLELTPSERANAGGMSNHAFLDNTPGMDGVKLDIEVLSKGEGIKGWANEVKRTP
jgi:serine/threonine-protein kinase SRPK3